MALPPWLSHPVRLACPQALLPSAGPCGQYRLARALGLRVLPRLPLGLGATHLWLNLFPLCIVGTVTGCASEVLLGVRREDVCQVGGQRPCGPWALVCPRSANMVLGSDQMVAPTLFCGLSDPCPL